ncbi:MAG: hypothetical protein ABF537_12020, partial [Acetobacter sp.]
MTVITRHTAPKPTSTAHPPVSGLRGYTPSLALRTGLLASGSALLCLWAAPIRAETAPNAAYLHMPHTQPDTQPDATAATTTVTAPAHVTGARIVTITPPASPPPQASFWG